MKNQNALISVIIPVYNVEKYLRKCIDSVVGQTYKNLEIILIDDGSPDNCGKICDEYAAKDNRIKVIHKKNQGVSAARNTGIELAHGEYIGFIDSDDVIAPTMYEKLFLGLQHYSAHIAMCQNMDILPNGEKRLGKFPHSKSYLYTKNEEWLSDFVCYGANQVVWNKLFARNLIGNTRFDSRLSRAEDLNFLLDLLPKSPSIIYVPEVLYLYIIRNNSAVHTKQIHHFLCEYTVWKRITNMLANNIFNTPVLSPAFVRRIKLHTFIPKAFKLAVLIILLDKNKKYLGVLKELQELFSQLYVSNDFSSCKCIIRVWTYAFVKFPRLTVTSLRLFGIHQLCMYIINHR